MPIKTYGVLKCKLFARLLATDDDNAHYQVWVKVPGASGDAQNYRISINARSGVEPKEILHLVVDGFNHPILSGLTTLSYGFTPLATDEGGLALDYVRMENSSSGSPPLFDPLTMTALSTTLPGGGHDVNDLLEGWLFPSTPDATRDLYAWGAAWVPKKPADEYFGFPGDHGIHNVHMNQGSAARFIREDGVWQDGAMFLHIPAESRWVAIFLGFQSQGWETDDFHGHVRVRIVAGLVNAPSGATLRAVMLLNNGPGDAQLQNWTLVDTAGVAHPFTTPITIRGGIATIVNLPAGADLTSGTTSSDSSTATGGS